MKKRGMLTVSILVGIIVIIILAIIIFFIITKFSTINNPVNVQKLELIQSSEKDKIDVVGSANVKEKADMVRVYLGYTNKGTNAKIVQEENARVMENVINAIKGEGISNNDISTQSFTIYPIRDYRITNAPITGYEARNILEIKIKNIENAGTVIDSATSGGANEINNIVFVFTDEKEKELKEKALKEATNNAKEKADVIANQLGLKLGKPIHISTTFDYQPQYRYNYYSTYGSAGASAEASSSTQITPSELTMSATISASFSFE